MVNEKGLSEEAADQIGVYVGMQGEIFLRFSTYTIPQLVIELFYPKQPYISEQYTWLPNGVCCRQLSSSMKNWSEAHVNCHESFSLSL